MSQGTFRPHLSVLQLRHALCYGKAEARPLSARGVGSRIKHVEDMRQIIGGYAGAMVSHSDRQISLRRIRPRFEGGGDLYGPFRAMTDGVVKEDAKYLLHPLEVCPRRRQILRHGDQHIPIHLIHTLNGSGDHLGQVYWSGLYSDPPSFDARHLQDILDEPRQPLRLVLDYSQILLLFFRM